MTNTQFALLILIATLFTAFLAWYQMADTLPPTEGSLLLRDDLMRLSGQ